MRQVFKSYLIAYINGFLFLYDKLLVRQFQSLPGEPPLRGDMKGLANVTFEGSKAAACQVSELFQGQVEHEVLLHIADQINFPRFFKICYHTVYVLDNSSGFHLRASRQSGVPGCSFLFIGILNMRN